MRVLLLADREPIPSVGAMLSGPRVDAVIGLGDLQVSWIESLANAPHRKLGVYGNHDEEPYMEWLGMEDLHGRAVSLGPLRVVGFEGCVRYRKGPHQFTQREAAKLAARLPPADVLVCHCPPAGINDDPDDVAHIGFEGLRDWVDRVQPRWILHGHTHPPPGTVARRCGSARVVHVSGARVVQLV